MEFTVNGIPVHYVEEGSGTPILALHGWAVDHRLMSGSMERLFGDCSGYRRIYPDLPGMGRTPALDTINSSDDLPERDEREYLGDGDSFKEQRGVGATAAIKTVEPRRSIRSA